MLADAGIVEKHAWDEPPTDRIDEILLDWYGWSSAYTPKLGYGNADPACRGFRSNRQWMTRAELSDEVDGRLRAETGRLVEPLIEALGLRERVAVNTAMRNFLAGARVWRNPRWPETQDADYACAKSLLRPQFVARGLLERPRA